MTCVITIFEMSLNNMWTKPYHFDEDNSLSLNLNQSVYRMSLLLFRIYILRL